MSFLVLDRLEKTYPDGTRAVKGIDLSIEEGELIVLLGPSGCGKTTTLRMIAGLELPTGGKITMGGREITQLRPSERDVGMVFQFYALYPHLSIEENIAFPLKAARLPRDEIRQRLDAVVERIGLQKLRRRYPRQLSGGDQQKVSLARAIVRRPAAYLMDEPLGTLDADQRLAMRELIRTQQLEFEVTTLYVTHDQEEAMSLADRIVVMEGGTIRQIGTPAEVYDRPADLFVANFVGSPGMSFVRGEVAARGSGSVFVSEKGRVEIPLAQAARPGRATLGIRGEHVHEDPQGPVGGTVVMDEYLGSARSIHLDADFGRIVMRSPAARARPTGAGVRFALDAAHVNVFDAETEARL